MPEDSSRAPDDAQPRADGRHPTPPFVPDHELLRRIGQGAYGEVWLARNVVGTLRAAKVVYRDAFTDARPYEREFEGIQKFEPLSRTHEGLVDILQIGLNESAGYFYYVMELADSVPSSEFRVPSSPTASAAEPQLGTRNPELGTYIPRTLASDLKSLGRLPLAQCLRTALALADALEHLHQHGLIHRDIKPSNIIFVNGTAKLADIGLVTETGAGKSWVGTEGFMPPEGPGTAQGDVYSLGKVLYEISTGKDRQRFPEPLTTLADLPDQADWLEFNEVVAKACEGNTKRRYASATELRGDLALLLGGKSVRRLRRMERMWARARYFLVAAVVLIAFGLVSQQWRLAAQRARAANVQAQAIREAAQAREESAAAQAREQATAEMLNNVQQRLLLEQIQQTRLTPHMQGWSTQVWAKAKEAASIRVNPDVRNYAAATLAGLDAHVIRHFMNLGSSSVAFDRTGERVLIGGIEDPRGYKNATFLWEISKNRTNTSKRAGTGPVAFAEDGRLLQLTFQGRLSFLLSDMAGRHAPRMVTIPAMEGPAPRTLAPPPVMAMTADGALIAAGAVLADGKSRIAVWETAEGKLVRQFENEHPLAALAFSTDATRIAAGDESGLIRNWRLSTGEASPPLQQGSNRVTTLAFRRDIVRDSAARQAGDDWLLAAGDAGGTVTLWDIRKRLPRNLFRGAHGDISALAFNPDGTILAAGVRNGVDFWDTGNGHLLLHIGSGDFVTGLAFSPDGGRLAVSAKGGFQYAGDLFLWSLEQGRGIQSLRGLQQRATRISFSADGQLVAALAWNWQVGVWSVTNSQLLFLFDVPPGAAADNASLRFSPDSRQLAFATASGACLWNVTTGQQSNSWPLPPGLVERLAFHPSGKLLLFRVETSDETRWPFIWVEPADHPRVCRTRDLFSPQWSNAFVTIRNFSFRVFEAALTADGEHLLVEGRANGQGSNEYHITIFQPLTGEELWPCESTVEGTLNIDPTGKYVELGRSQTNIVLLDLRLHTIVKQFERGPSALGPEARQWIERGQPPDYSEAYSLMVEGRKEPLVKLGLDFSSSWIAFPTFSNDGSLLAWGDDHGTVYVADLEEINRRLTELGLGW